MSKQHELAQLGFTQDPQEGPWNMWKRKETEDRWTVVALNTADGSVSLEKYYHSDANIGVTITCTRWDVAVLAILKAWGECA